eukprot:scaffold125504_cov20-Prasinocladus_malaysianus.AAC.1
MSISEAQNRRHFNTPDIHATKVSKTLRKRHLVLKLQVSSAAGLIIPVVVGGAGKTSGAIAYAEA